MVTCDARKNTCEPPQDGEPLSAITLESLTAALEALALPSEFITAASELITRRFRGADLTHRQLAAFIRFGRAPANSLGLPRTARPIRRRRGRPLDAGVKLVYEHPPSDFSSVRSVAATSQRKALPKSCLPSATLVSEKTACNAALAPLAAPAGGAPAARMSLASGSVPVAQCSRSVQNAKRPTISKSAPTLPAITHSKRGDAGQPHYKVGEPRLRESLALPQPDRGFSFGRAARFDGRVVLPGLAVQNASSTSPGSGSFGRTRVTLSNEARLFAEDMRSRLNERKAKLTSLMEDLDADRDGEIDREELRAKMRTVLACGVEPSDEVVDTVLHEFDRDGNGVIDTHELRRALWGTHQLLTQELQAGGAGKFRVGGDSSKLRKGVDGLHTAGRKLLRTDTEELPDAIVLRERLRELLCTHPAAVVDSLHVDGDRVVDWPEFYEVVSRKFGLDAARVGAAASAVLLDALQALYVSWDAASVGVSMTELNRILRRGGQLWLSRRTKSDAIFQTEIATVSVPSSSSRIKKSRAQKLSEARQALHGFVIQSREEQLRRRAERVAPVQLEALMQAMAEDSETVLDLFLKWDSNGDGTVCAEEFNAAVAQLGFKFCREVTDELFTFFDKDNSGLVTLEEIETTLNWGRSRKHMRPLLAGWRQLTLTLDPRQPLHEQIRWKLNQVGISPITMFKHWDEAGDGKLNREELRNLVKTLGGLSLSHGEMDKLFESFDSDASGTVSFKELTSKLRDEVPIEKLMSKLAEPGLSDALFEVFKKLDINGDGVLDREEFDLALFTLGVDVTDERSKEGLFRMLDEDESGTVSLKELQNSLRWVRSCEKCHQLRTEAFTFGGTLSIQTQIRRALAANSVRVMVSSPHSRGNHAVRPPALPSAVRPPHSPTTHCARDETVHACAASRYCDVMHIRSQSSYS